MQSLPPTQPAKTERSIIAIPPLILSWIIPALVAFGVTTLLLGGLLLFWDRLFPGSGNGLPSNREVVNLTQVTVTVNIQTVAAGTAQIHAAETIQAIEAVATFDAQVQRTVQAAAATGTVQAAEKNVTAQAQSDATVRAIAETATAAAIKSQETAQAQANATTQAATSQQQRKKKPFYSRRLQNKCQPAKWR